MDESDLSELVAVKSDIAFLFVQSRLVSHTFPVLVSCLVRCFRIQSRTMDDIKWQDLGILMRLILSCWSDVVGVLTIASDACRSQQVGRGTYFESLWLMLQLGCRW